MADEKKPTEEKVKKMEEKSDILTEEKPKNTPSEPKKKVKKIKKQISKGRAIIKCTYNNTIVSITDLNGGVLAWASSGLLGFKGAKKSTPYAATQVVGSLAEKVSKFGIKELEVYVKGVGSGRESAIRALSNNGFNLVMIKDVTPIPHNGCRPKKPRRI